VPSGAAGKEPLELDRIGNAARIGGGIWPVGHRCRPRGPASRPASRSGIDTEYESRSTRPQDDLYRYLNGKWLDEFQIPADKGIYVSLPQSLIAPRPTAHHRGRSGATLGGDGRGGPGGGRTGASSADLYASFMDEPRLETLGAKPLETRLPPSMLYRPRSRFLR